MARPVLWAAEVTSHFFVSAAGSHTTWSVYPPRNSCCDTFKDVPPQPGWRTCRSLYTNRNTVTIGKHCVCFCFGVDTMAHVWVRVFCL